MPGDCSEGHTVWPTSGAVTVSVVAVVVVVAAGGGAAVVVAVVLARVVVCVVVGRARVVVGATVVVASVATGSVGVVSVVGGAACLEEDPQAAVSATRAKSTVAAGRRTGAQATRVAAWRPCVM